MKLSIIVPVYQAGKYLEKCTGSDRRKLFPVTLYISGLYQERILICSHGISRIAIL